MHLRSIAGAPAVGVRALCIGPSYALRPGRLSGVIEYAIAVWDGPVNNDSEMLVMTREQATALGGAVYAREVGPWTVLSWPEPQ